jgi:hypothetical protein
MGMDQKCWCESDAPIYDNGLCEVCYEQGVEEVITYQGEEQDNVQ